MRIQQQKEMMDLKSRAENLLTVWCESLRSHQIIGLGDREIEGAMVCPACHLLHGRCFEAMVAFLYMYGRTGDRDWIDRSEKLFHWADGALSLPDGSFRNDRGSNWIGTTVFNTVALCDSVISFGDVLSSSFAVELKRRIRRSADFLYAFDRLKENNVNYPLTNCLALKLSSIVLGDRRYERKALDFLKVLDEVVTENGFILGEGVPRDVISPRGCRSMDVGYDVEETLPSLLRYARLTGNKELEERAEKLVDNHMMFFLDDGGWDNSFGTRNFKWTYWGSRTSDGSLPALLHMAGRNSWYLERADKVLGLLEKCTIDGLLSGGPDYGIEGERICIHHTFEHARMVANALLEGLFDIPEATESHPVGRDTIEGFRHFPEIDSYIGNGHVFTSTVSFYDWGYANLAGGHVSGGSLSMLYQKGHGPLLVAGMGEYSRREPFNMQMPIHPESHECLDFRIEAIVDGKTYSSIYDEKAKAKLDGNVLEADGVLTASDGTVLSDGRYMFRYVSADDSFKVAVLSERGKLIVPVLARCDEKFSVDGNDIVLEKQGGRVVLSSDRKAFLPYGEKRIFNLIPGFQAVRLEFDGKVNLCFHE